MKTKIQPVFGSFCAWPILLLFATLNVGAQYNFIPLSFAPAGISGDYIVGGNTLYDFVTQTYTTLNLPGSAVGIDGSNIVGNDSNGAFVYNIVSQTYIDYNVPRGDPRFFGVSGISGNNLVGSYSFVDLYGNNSSAGYVYNTISQTYTTLRYTFFLDGSTYLTYAFGIDGDNVVGNYWPGGSYYNAFVYNGVGYSVFSSPFGGGPTTTWPTGISGDNIVGWAEGSFTQQPYGFLYNTTSRTFTDFGSGKLLGIDGNDIIGETSIGSGFFLAVPAPEPSSIPLLALGFAALLIFRSVRVSRRANPRGRGPRSGAGAPYLFA
jgi:hypothetical protein